MSPKTRFAALISFVLFSVWGANAFACKCERNIRPVSKSKIVFWGKVKSVTPRGSQDRIEFEVTQVYKGDEKEAVSVYSNRFHHDCGIRFEVDKTYMVYAYDFYPRGVATSMCWGTTPAEEAVPVEDWKKLKVSIPDDTKVEEQLRKISKKIVPRCGAKHRVQDAGFEMILSPDGDPIRPPPPLRIRERIDEFQECVGEGFLEVNDLPKPDKPVQIMGWYQKDYKPIPVLLDEIPCAENCQDWVTRVKAELMDPKGPEPADKISFDLHSEFKQCLEGGVSAVGAESHGTDSVKMRRDRVLADCVAQRGELDQLDPFMDQIPNTAVVAALKWAKAKQVPEGGSLYPISTGTPTYPDVWMKGKPNEGKFRILRSNFVADNRWAESPLYLEAFAESILGDKDAPKSMRDLASLAFHRAGLMMPKAAEAYEKLADKASRTKEAQELRDQFSAEWTKLYAPPVEETPEPVEVAPVEQPVQEQPPSGQNPILLIVAGLLIVVAIGGIGIIIKRRR